MSCSRRPVAYTHTPDLGSCMCAADSSSDDATSKRTRYFYGSTCLCAWGGFYTPLPKLCFFPVFLVARGVYYVSRHGNDSPFTHPPTRSNFQHMGDAQARKTLEKSASSRLWNSYFYHTSCHFDRLVKKWVRRFRGLYSFSALFWMKNHGMARCALRDKTCL